MPWTLMDGLPISIRPTFTSKHVCNCSRASFQVRVRSVLPRLLSLKMSTPRPIRLLASELLRHRNGVLQRQPVDRLRSPRRLLGRLQTGIAASMNFSRMHKLRPRFRLRLKPRQLRPKLKPKPRLRLRLRPRLRHKHRFKRKRKLKLKLKPRPRPKQLMASIIATRYVARRNRVRARNKEGCSLRPSAPHPPPFALLRPVWPDRMPTTLCPNLRILLSRHMSELLAALVRSAPLLADLCPQLLLSAVLLAVLRLLAVPCLLTTIAHSLRPQRSDRSVRSDLLRRALPILTSNITMALACRCKDRVVPVLPGVLLRRPPQSLLQRRLPASAKSALLQL